MADPKLNLLKGCTGIKNKRIVEGEKYALGILVQDEEDLLEVKDEDTGVTHILDRNDRAVSDPVYRALRAQARQGVGNGGGMLPPAIFNSLSDRAFGKVADKLRLKTGRPYANESDEQLRERLARLQGVLAKVPKAKEA